MRKWHPKIPSVNKYLLSDRLMALGSYPALSVDQSVRAPAPDTEAESRGPPNPRRGQIAFQLATPSAGTCEETAVSAEEMLQHALWG